MICFMHSKTDDTLLGTEHEESEVKLLGLANTDFELSVRITMKNIVPIRYSCSGENYKPDILFKYCRTGNS